MTHVPGSSSAERDFFTMRSGINYLERGNNASVEKGVCFASCRTHHGIGMCPRRGDGRKNELH